jgi:hypothetical protein
MSVDREPAGRRPGIIGGFRGGERELVGGLGGVYGDVARP